MKIIFDSPEQMKRTLKHLCPDDVHPNLNNQCARDCGYFTCQECWERAKDCIEIEVE